jgi:uncharacterized Zn-finger protein
MALWFVKEATPMKYNAKTMAQKKVVIYKKDLPLCCPMPKTAVWNEHPRVYLPIEEEKNLLCPYCGTHYERGHD